MSRRTSTARKRTPRPKGRRWSWGIKSYGDTVRIWMKPSGRFAAQIHGRRFAVKGVEAGDIESAKAWVRDQVQRRTDDAVPFVPTVARICARYVRTQTPRKRGRASRCQDHRAATMWARVLGGKKDLRLVSLGEWQSFVDRRGSGAITGRGEPVPETPEEGEPRRRPVGATAIAMDLLWLRGVIRWAITWRDADTGRYLMTEDPTRGFAVPHEENPKRPVATTDRFEQVVAVAPQIHPMLPVLVTLAQHTGRRIGAILGLRYQDLRLDVRPHGVIDWPARTDKLRKRWADIPLHPAARAALDAWLATHPGIGAAYVFAWPADPSRPVDRDLASKWLEKAERVAKLTHLDGGLWHAYRRGWATARKGLELQDVMAAGGWGDPTCLQTIYQQADPVTLRRVVIEAPELREAEA